MNKRELERTKKRHDDLMAELRATRTERAEDEGHRRQRQLRTEAMRLAQALKEAAQ